MSKAPDTGGWKAKKNGQEREQQVVMLCLAVINHLCFVFLH